MNKLKLLIIIGFAFVLSLKQSNCQELKNYCRVRGSFYREPNGKTDINKLHGFSGGGSVAWKVYSDRENNQAYKFPDKTSPVVATLHFMEKFMVGKENEEWLYLIKDEKAEGDKPSSVAKPIGWVQKKDLLLWGHCLVSDTSNVNKKAMIINSEEFVKSDDFKKANSDNVTFASHPSMDLSKYSTGKKANIKSILYIYKKEKSACLLGAFTNIGASVNSGGDLMLGWVNSNRMETWNHRVALEPNWDMNAVKERQSGSGIKILRSTGAVLEYCNSGKVDDKDNIVWDYDPYAKRFPGEFIRFPFLKLMGNKVVAKVGVVAKVIFENTNSLGNENTPPIVDIRKRKSKLNEFIDEQDKLNLVFVLDGTRSITPYYPSIVNGIQDGISSLNDKEVKFAAVVYSDKNESNYEIQKQDITTKDNLTSFLKDRVIFPDNSIFTEEDKLKGWGENRYKSADTDMEEAVFKGLDVALNELNLKKNETNIFILIGDYGNNSDVRVFSTDKIAKDLAFISQGFLVIQAKRPNDILIDECKGVLLKSAQNYYDRLKEIANQYSASKVAPPDFENNAQSYTLIPNTPYTGWLKFPTSVNGEISSADISKEIKDIVQKTKSNNITDLVKLEKGVDEGNGLGKVVQSDYGINRKALLWIERLKKDKIENYNLLNSKNVEIFTTGYTTLSSKNSVYPYYNRMLFVSHDELNELIVILKRLSEYEGSKKCEIDVRKCLVDAWIEILTETLGKTDEKDILEMDYSKMQQLVYGLPEGRISNCKGVDFLNKKLNCLMDPSCLTNDQINEYCNCITKGYDYLKKIYDSPNFEYTIKNYENKQTYYWIEEKYLP